MDVCVVFVVRTVTWNVKRHEGRKDLKSTKMDQREKTPDRQKKITVGARSSAPVQTGPGAYPASYTMGAGSFPGVKRPGRGADHPPPTSTEVKNEYSYTSTPPLGLRGLL
jgi:hypothetical protein